MWASGDGVLVGVSRLGVIVAVGLGMMEEEVVVAMVSRTGCPMNALGPGRARAVGRWRVKVRMRVRMKVSIVSGGG